MAERATKRTKTREDFCYHDHSEMTLPVRHHEVYNSPRPFFEKPFEIGYFSVDCERRYCNDGRNMKYLTREQVGKGPVMDLNEGFEVAVRKEHCSNEGLDLLLQYIKKNLDPIRIALPTKDSNQIFGADFVCYRGLLTAISCTLYENQDDWIICATKFRGTIYLCAFHTDQKLRKEQNSTLKDSLMSYWGYKFEQYMVADTPEGQPNIHSPLNEKEEFCIAVKRQMGKHTVLFSAEVDGIDPKEKINKGMTDHYIELKTSRLITSDRQRRNFHRYKLVKSWAQSYYIGIPRILYGFRDDNGVVQEIVSYPTSFLAKMGKDFWSPYSMMNFLEVFLSFIKKCVSKDDPRIVYKFSWSPRHDIVGIELSHPSEYQILPEWYINSFN